MKKNNFYSEILLGLAFILITSSLIIAQNNNANLKTIKIYVQYNLAKDGLLNKNDINVRVDSNKIFLNGIVRCGISQ